MTSVGGSVECEGSGGLGVNGDKGLSDKGSGTKGGVLGSDTGERSIGDGDGGVATGDWSPSLFKVRTTDSSSVPDDSESCRSSASRSKCWQ